MTKLRSIKRKSQNSHIFVTTDTNKTHQTHTGIPHCFSFTVPKLHLRNKIIWLLLRPNFLLVIQERVAVKAELCRFINDHFPPKLIKAENLFLSRSSERSTVEKHLSLCSKTTLPFLYLFFSRTSRLALAPGGTSLYRIHLLDYSSRAKKKKPNLACVSKAGGALWMLPQPSAFIGGPIDVKQALAFYRLSIPQLLMRRA